jgi:hypothetical protein
MVIMKKLFVNGLNSTKEFEGWDNEEVKIDYANFLKQFNKKDTKESRYLFIANGSTDYVRVSIRNALELWMCVHSDSMIPEFRDSECDGFGIFDAEKMEGQCFLREDEIKWDESEDENGNLILHIWNVDAKENSDVKVKINKDSILKDLYPTTGNEDYVLVTDGKKYEFQAL